MADLSRWQQIVQGLLTHLISCRLTIPIGCTSIDFPQNLVFTCISAHHSHVIVWTSDSTGSEQRKLHNYYKMGQRPHGHHRHSNSQRCSGAATKQITVNTGNQ